MAHHKRRPAAVTWLAVAVFLLSVANLGSVYTGVTRGSVVSSLNLALPLWMSMSLGGLWGIIWLVLCLGLWQLRPWARRVMLVVFPLYEVVVIGRQALFARGAYERGRLSFAMGMAIILTLLIIWALNRPRIRCAFESECEETKHS